MDRRIRLVALFLVLCFGLLVVQLNNLQVHQASALNAKSAYTATKVGLPSFEESRGEILTADGVVIARSEPTNDQYHELRVYPQGPLYEDVTGYYDTTAYSAPLGVEAEYDSYLQPHTSSAKTIRQMLTEQTGTDTVVTTINSTVQLAAETALEGYANGAVVAIDTRTGAILALYGKPVFDPNKLAVHDATAATKAYNDLEPQSGSSPLVNYATQTPLHPGSTFKVITTSAMYDHMPSLTTSSWPVVGHIPLPESNLTLQNYGGEPCGGTLPVVLAKSCDTSYAKIGLQLGAPNLAAEAASFGFNETPPIDLPSSEVSASCFPPVDNAKSTNPSCGAGVTSIGAANQPGTAYSAIGQENVTETALQDAMIAAALADGGKMMTPHLMSKVVSNTGSLVTSYSPTTYKQATTSATAGTVLQLMRGVVTNGTANPVGFPASENVAAKTGTAESGSQNCSTNWLIADVPAGPGQTPSIAVAAVVPYQNGTTCNGTGAQFAGPVVKAVLAAALAAQS